MNMQSRMYCIQIVTNILPYASVLCALNSVKSDKIN